MTDLPPSALLMRRIADLVAARYVHPDIGRRIAAHLTAGVVTPDPAEDPESFAEAATTHLRAVNGDRCFASQPHRLRETTTTRLATLAA